MCSIVWPPNGVRADAVLFDLGVSEHADRPAPSAASPMPVELHWICAWIPPRTNSARDLVNEASAKGMEKILPPLRRGALPAKSIARAIRGVGRGGGEDGVHAYLRAGQRRSEAPFRRRHGFGRDTRQASLPGTSYRRSNDEAPIVADAPVPARSSCFDPAVAMAVISFHSARGPHREALPARQGARLHLPPDFPICNCGHEAEMRLLGRKAIRPGPRELALNPRAASARLRAAVKL